jgi:hypothetical protein
MQERQGLFDAAESLLAARQQKPDDVAPIRSSRSTRRRSRR